MNSPALVLQDIDRIEVMLGIGYKQMSWKDPHSGKTVVALGYAMDDLMVLQTMYLTQSSHQVVFDYFAKADWFPLAHGENQLTATQALQEKLAKLPIENMTAPGSTWIRAIDHALERLSHGRTKNSLPRDFTRFKIRSL